MLAAKTQIRMNTTEPSAPSRAAVTFVPRVMTLGGRSNARTRLAALTVIACSSALRDIATPAVRTSATL
ncbi:MAG: hypothetical protein DWH75_01470 [Planctomycetota bacterium]|nr:MAG: hypothetical protein DWH75_01470 [Planctomycetota bacterium]